MRDIYWRIWWWFRDRYDAWFVKEVMRRMEHGERGALYIHPNGESPAAYVIVQPSCLEWLPSSHSHVEGRMELHTSGTDAP